MKLRSPESNAPNRSTTAPATLYRAWGTGCQPASERDTISGMNSRCSGRSEDLPNPGATAQERQFSNIARVTGAVGRYETGLGPAMSLSRSIALALYPSWPMKSKYCPSTNPSALPMKFPISKPPRRCTSFANLAKNSQSVSTFDCAGCGGSALTTSGTRVSFQWSRRKLNALIETRQTLSKYTPPNAAPASRDQSSASVY